MAGNFYSNYDPISANGILYAPINNLVFSEAPVTIPRVMHPNFNYQELDKFVSTAKNPNPTPTWKKVAFWTLAAGLAIFGLKKLKINPFKKIFKNFPQKHPKIAQAYNKTAEFISDKYNKVSKFFKNIFKKK